MIRKISKWIGIGFGIVVLWFIVMMIAGAVVKDRVPVNLSPSKMVFGVQDSYAVAQSAWVLENDQQAFPLQTTQIRCEKELKRCTSGTASVMLGDQLNVDVSFYDIIAWEKSRVVFTDDSPQCVSYVYTIDLVTKVANGDLRRPGPRIERQLAGPALHSRCRPEGDTGLSATERTLGNSSAD